MAMTIRYASERLDHGIRLVTAQAPFWHSAALALYVAAGSRHEPTTAHGIAHFTEHMLFKGTPRRTALRIVQEAEGVGASLNAYTSEEHTCYHVKSLATDLPRMADLLADLYRHSLFLPEDIAHERQVIEDEILANVEQPSSHIDDLLSRAAWPSHPLGNSILGTSESLRPLVQRDFQAYASRCHVGANTVIAVAGPLEHAAVRDLLAPLFDTLPPGSTIPFQAFPTDAPTPLDARTALEDRPLQQTQLALGFYTEGRHTPQLYASRLLSVLLGETMSSRLFQELREKLGLCYHTATSRDLYSEAGLFSIQAAFEARHLSRILRLIATECQGLRATPPDSLELQRAIDYLSGQHIMSMEDPGSQIFWLGELTLQDETELDPRSYLERLRQVTPEAIQETAQAIFKRSGLSLALLGNEVAACRDLSVDQLASSLPG